MRLFSKHNSYPRSRVEALLLVGVAALVTVLSFISYQIVEVALDPTELGEHQ